MSMPPLLLLPSLITPEPKKLWTPQDGLDGAPTVQRVLGKPKDLLPAQLIKLWRERPSIFIKDHFNVTLDLWQEEATEAYCTFERVAVVANKGPGKTGWLAFMGLHFMMTNSRPKMAAISVTKDHLQDNLWAELLKWRSLSPSLVKSLTEGSEKIALVGHEKYSFISARSYPKDADESQQATALAGLHEENAGFLIDEAGIIPDAVLATADAALSTEGKEHSRKRILVTANPERPSGMIYRASLGQTVQEWKVLHVTGDPDDPKRSPRVRIEWAREQILTYGADHPWVQINVFGRYPKTSAEQLLSEAEISESMKRTVTEDMVKNVQNRLGIDVSRGGADSTVFAQRKGLKAYAMEQVSSEVFGPELAGKAVFYSRERGVERVYIDGTGGYGSSVYDSLVTFTAVDCTSVIYNATAQESKLYANRRTENWVRMRDWVRRGGQLPNDPGLAQELMMPKLFFHGSKFHLEAKDQIKKRLGRSPDKADALSQTFSDVEEFSINADLRKYVPDPDAHLSDVQYMMKHRQQVPSNYITDESQIDNYHRQSSNYKS